LTLRKDLRALSKAWNSLRMSLACQWLVLTDSGGVQEESCILGVPCVTLRDNTERPETLEVGSNVLAGTEPERIFEGVRLMLNKENNWLNPFGDGNAGERIVEILKRFQ